MAVLGRVLVSSAERLDLPDFLSLDSFAQGDFKYLMQSFVGADKPYVLTGFDVINPSAAIGTQNISVRVADSVVYYPGSLAGPFFYGLEEGNVQATPLIPELRKNATNYVYLTFTTTEAAADTRAFWDPDKEGGVGGEFTQDVNTQTVLTVAVNVSVSAFPDNTIPVAKVVVGANFIEDITDARDMMFRLASGGLTPNPLATYQFRSEPSAAYSRNEPNITMTSALDPNPFQGGDKNFRTLKEWMDVVMTKLLELSGTTYWYEDTTSFALISAFKDALATSIKSKGMWQSSDTTPGLLAWTEDIVIQSVSDQKDVIIRSGSKTLADGQVMYIDRNRGNAINTGSVPVDWFNGLTYVNGTLGSFESLTKGDWVKKADDPDYRYLRVEEFYAGINLGGGVTAPGNALSIKLSSSYSGISETKYGTYVQGEYLSTDVQVGNRDDVGLTDAGGNLYWLAMRSDKILNVSSISSTTLPIDISNHDGAKATVTSVAHGLSDKQIITIAGSTNFDGTYQVEVDDADTFHINVSGGPFADEASQSAYYATITTSSRSTANGYLLESASHGLDIDQKITISDTTNYNGTHTVFVVNPTAFTIPVSGPIANELSGTVTSVDLYLRTDVGPTKLTQGENKSVGEIETEGILSFIGMDNDAQTYPTYHVPTTYNTLYGQTNFNSDLTDNLTQRASKLTAMMADKAQDKTIVFAPTYDTLTNTTNGSNQDITFAHSSGTPMLDIIMSSSQNNGSIDLSGTLSLAANKAAYFTVDRNASFSLASLAALTVVNITDVPVGENTFVFAVRGSGDSIWIWDGTEMSVGDNLPLSVISEILNENAYDEKLTIVAGAPASTNEATGPISAGSLLSLPNDSRDGGASQGYIVGQGVLEVYLNGQELINGDDWSEVGTAGTASTIFQIDIDLEVDDILLLRIDTAGGYFGVGGGGGGGEANDGLNVGTGEGVFKSKVGTILQFKSLTEGSDVNIVANTNDLNIGVKTGRLNIVAKAITDTLTLDDDVVLVNASGGAITINLPAAATSTRKVYNIKKIDATANNVVIDAFGSETIDGVTTLTTSTQYESFTIICDGTAWYII